MTLIYVGYVVSGLLLMVGVVGYAVMCPKLAAKEAVKEQTSN